MASRQPLMSVAMNTEIAEEPPSAVIPLFEGRFRRATDLDTFEARIDELKALLNDPVALLTRAKELLEGVARPILALGPGAIVPLRFVASIALLVLSPDLPGTLDDAARDALNSFLDQTQTIGLVHWRALMGLSH